MRCGKVVGNSPPVSSRPEQFRRMPRSRSPPEMPTAQVGGGGGRRRQRKKGLRPRKKRGSELVRNGLEEFDVREVDLPRHLDQRSAADIAGGRDGQMRAGDATTGIG